MSGGTHPGRVVTRWALALLVCLTTALTAATAAAASHPTEGTFQQDPSHTVMIGTADRTAIRARFALVNPVPGKHSSDHRRHRRHHHMHHHKRHG